MTESNTHSTPPDAPSDSADPAIDTDTPTATESSSGDVLGAGAGNTTEKEPADWVTADEPMTGAQRSYLDTLAREAGETLSADLTKAEASEQIERLQAKTGRGES